MPRHHIVPCGNLSAQECCDSGRLHEFSPLSTKLLTQLVLLRRTKVCRDITGEALAPHELASVKMKRDPIPQPPPPESENLQTNMLLGKLALSCGAHFRTNTDKDYKRPHNPDHFICSHADMCSTWTIYCRHGALTQVLQRRPQYAPQRPP